MAVSEIKCTDWYTEGEAINLCGTWLALSGQSQPINGGFTVPAKKRIPQGATFTLSNLSFGWLRGDNTMLTPVLKDAYISGDSVIVEVKASEGMASLTFYCVYIRSGEAIIHL